jgi:hypothetical protein
MSEAPFFTGVGAERAPVRLSPGDPWPLPYRGSRYSIREVNRFLKAVWASEDDILLTTTYPKQTVDALRKVSKPRGSFRITAHGAVITKVAKDGDGPWHAIYVGPYSNDLSFPSIELNPTGLKQGMHWTGLPFQHGEIWTVSPRPGASNILTWKHEGVTLGSTEPYPDLFRQYLSIRPRGGRVHFTEYGHVWMNLPDDEVSYAFRDEFRKIQSEQIDSLAKDGKTTILRLLQLRLIRTNCRPVYLGRTNDFDSGEAPWTLFTPFAVEKFGKGSEDAGDGDVWDGDE